MRLAVVSHKPCWESDASPSGYATDGGFPFQIQALSQLFDATTLLVPVTYPPNRGGQISLAGHRLTVAPLGGVPGEGAHRKLRFPFWAMRNSPTLLRRVGTADVVHAPIPGDVGTLGILVALMLRKKLFVRHCGNWFKPRTAAEHFWKWMMGALAGRRGVMLATGGAVSAPSERNPEIRWIFSTTLTEKELAACARPRQRLPGDSPRLIVVGRQEHEKGTGVVIDSLPLLLRDFPGATLEVVGEGRALGEFQSRVAELGLGERVTFLGRVDHSKVIERLQLADVFCFPTSSSEGFPKVALEALACGVPVVTTRVSVLPQLIANGCGLILKEVTPAAVAEAVRACLSEEEVFLRMSRNAVEAARRYSLEKWQATIGDLLRREWGPLRSDA